jgi:hypothetical protein
MELPGEKALAIKELGSGNGLEAIQVGGASGYWISGPHDLIVRTPTGAHRFRVTGNVLVWQVGNLSLRLESGLTKKAAIQLAQAIG